MNIAIIEDIDEEALEAFSQQVNTVEEKENIVVYLNSLGGDPRITPIFKDIIERHQMRLVACSKIYSSALDLFLTTNTPRTILDHTVGMYHQAVVVNVTIDNSSNVQVEPKLKKIWKENIWGNGLTEKFLEITQKEIKQTKKGKELYYSTDELKKALQKSEKYFDSLEK